MFTTTLVFSGLPGINSEPTLDRSGSLLSSGTKPIVFTPPVDTGGQRSPMVTNEMAAIVQCETCRLNCMGAKFKF